MKKIVSGNSASLIYGVSTINHRIRYKLGINCSEYVIMDFIYKNKGFSVLHDKDREPLWKALGVTHAQIESCITHLIAREFLRVVKISTVEVTEKWINCFEGTYEDEFEILWKLYTAVGNKRDALICYNKLRNEGLEFEYFKQRIELYNRFLEITERFKLHMSTFLSLKRRNFENEEYDLVVQEHDQNSNNDSSTDKFVL